MGPILIFPLFHSDLCFACVLRTLWQVMAQDEFDEKPWLELHNVNEESAKSRYYMEPPHKYEGFVDGSISVAFWCTEGATTPCTEKETTQTLFYYLNGDIATVESLECTDDDNSDVVNVYRGDEEQWGTVLVCEQGPQLTYDLRTQHDDKNVTSPTIIMNNTNNDEVYLIVEESSSYPNFLYSVWAVGSQDGSLFELEYKFYISATMRLVEAVVTGIVHGDISGGACFGLLRKFSESRENYGSVASRAAPFGERPGGDTVQIQQLEKVEVGLKINVNALLCFICIMLLTSIGIAWSFCLRSSIGMDVYDRDELIRAISVAGTTASDTSPSDMRIFVHKQDTGDMKVVINDTGCAHNGCARILRRGGRVVEDSEPSPVVSGDAPYNGGFGGAVVPMGSRTVVLEGVRIRPSRALPGPSGNYHYPTSYSLTASPVPSNSSSRSGTPVRCHSPPKFALRMGGGSKGGRGASALFDTAYSPSDSDDGETCVTKVTRGAVAVSDGTPDAFISAFADQGDVPAVPEGVRPSDVEMTRQLDSGQKHGTLHSSPDRTTADVSEGLSPLPPLIIGRDHTLGPPQLGPLTSSFEEESRGGIPSSEDMC